MDIKERLGKKVRALRERASMSQEELAHGAGVDRVYLGQLERGEKGAGIDTMEKLARALKVDVRDLLDVDGEPPRVAKSAHERLGERVAVLAQAAPAREIERFEALARTFFSAFQPRRKRKTR